ncbi:MAG: erythromycin esterase family protein [Odoribacter sp.]|nr:erythromycin esterase family protein [Odoribacter sp.]
MDYYNLDLSTGLLEDGLRWTAKVSDDTMEFRIVQEIDEDLRIPVFCLSENVSLDGRRWRLNTVLAQQFPLYGKFSNAEIDVNVKGVNLQQAWMKVSSLDVKERNVRTDSVRMEGDGWHNYKLKIPLKGISYLWLAFHVEGRPCAFHDGAKMLIQGLRLSLDGHSINEVGLPQGNADMLLDTTALLPLSFVADSLIDKIDLLKNNPKIIGLAETMHGSYSLGRVQNQLIRWLVEKKQCKLIMAELPTMLVLKWDLYVQGYPVCLEEILEELVGAAQCRSRVKELLEFLRGYNAKAVRKVHIAGFDRSIPMGYFPLAYDYFYEMYKHKPNKMLYDVLRTRLVPDSLLPLTVKKQFSEQLGVFESQWFGQLYWLKVMEKHIPDVEENGRMYFRDYIMWRHVYYALKAVDLQGDECAVLTGHWLHLNKLNNVAAPVASLGCYLNENYGERYCVLTLLGGEGEYQTYRSDMNSFVPVPVASPVFASLERSGLQTGVPYFYYPASRLSDSPLNIRCSPAGFNNQSFRAFNLPLRTDGFIFVRTCEAARIPEEQRSYQAMHILLDKRLVRMMRRVKELSSEK